MSLTSVHHFCCKGIRCRSFIVCSCVSCDLVILFWNCVCKSHWMSSAGEAATATNSSNPERSSETSGSCPAAVLPTKQFSPIPDGHWRQRLFFHRVLARTSDSNLVSCWLKQFSLCSDFWNGLEISMDKGGKLEAKNAWRMQDDQQGNSRKLFLDKWKYARRNQSKAKSNTKLGEWKVQITVSHK